MTRAERRYSDKRHALRKKKISDNYACWIADGSHYYDNLHQYSKNKIHCSCWICRTKSYDQMSHSDLIKLIRLTEQLD